ncbi:MAG: caspase family protein [Thiotrichales bacterium]|nr:MAG: caspase family protein [Thiotrichales bacterium]
MNRKLTALIVGVADYPNGGALKNPENDAQDVANALERLGFSMVRTINPTVEELDRALESFKDNLNSNDVGLFYFAGHGMQIKGENYLNAIDTNFHDEISAKHSSFPLNQVIEVMDSCSNKTNIIILDACRNNPF